MSESHEEEGALFEQAAEQVIQLGNDLVDQAGEDEDVDPWEVAAGLLAGTVQFWLFAHQPCDEPDCEDCAPVSTSALRLKMLLNEVQELAESSDYFHTPNDSDVGNA